MIKPVLSNGSDIVSFTSANPQSVKKNTNPAQNINNYKKQLLKTLTKAKDIDGKENRFSIKAIDRIIENINEQNKEYLPVFLNAKTLDGKKYRFLGSDIGSMIESVEEQNKEILDTLLNTKTLDEKVYRFNGLEIGRILGNLKEQNKEFLPVLLDTKTLDGKEYRFDGSEIECIFDRIKDGQNIEYLSALLDAKTLDGKKYRFLGSDIANILENVKKRNKEYVHGILNAKTLDGENFRFRGVHIEGILDSIKEENKEYLPVLLDAKALDGKNYRFNGPDIREILKNLNKESKNYLNHILEAKRLEDKGYRFDGSEIGYIFDSIKEENKEYLPVLLNAKALDGKNYRFNGSDTREILENVNDESKNYLSSLLDAKSINDKEYRFNGNDIGWILENLHEENKDHLSPLLDTKTLDGKGYRFGGDIGNILKYIKNENKECLPVLLNAKASDGEYYRFTGFDIGNILRHIEKENNEFLPVFLNAKTLDGENYRFNTANIKILLDSTIKEENKEYLPAILNAKTNDGKEHRFNCQDIKNILSSPVEVVKSVISKPLEEINLEELTLLAEKSRDNESDFIEELSKAIINKIECRKPFDPKTIDKINNSINNLNKSLALVNLERFAQTRLPLSKDKKHIDLNQIPYQYKPLFNDLNVIIKSFPEFAKTIGRKQHETQAYTLDIHMLKTLQETLNDPDYKKLADKDKKIAKYAILFHDIDKREGEIDPEHPEHSAFTVYGMMRKLDMPIRDVERIIGLVRNHHWLQNIDEKEIYHKDAAFIFRKPGDFDIAKIFAKADLKAVGNGFEKQHLPKLEEAIPIIEKQINYIHNTGIFLPQTSIPGASKLNCQHQDITDNDGNKTTNKIIKIDKNTDFEMLGFEKGTNYDNFRVIIHAINNGNTNITKDIAYASMEGKNGCFSTSYISPDRVFTFYNLKSGLVFDVDNNNIANALNKNIGSGTDKDLIGLKNLVFTNENDVNDKINQSRVIFSKRFKELGRLNNRQYSEKYRELSQYHSFTDIKDENLRKLVSKVVNETVLNNTDHNEIVVYAPKPVGIFSKESSPEKIPYHLRLFAQEHDLPILIFDKPALS